MTESGALMVRPKAWGMSYLEGDDHAVDVVQTFYEDRIVLQVELRVCEVFQLAEIQV